ncbi:MAG TPA: hypothetical protein VHQ89_03985 [Gaiellaceae bacterium]|nr:hypothetical protein [Gaiellaceae bacterium]
MTTTAATTATAPQAFSITGVSAPAPGAYSAHIVWTTTEPAAATLQWGPTELQPLLWTDAPHSTTTHDLTLDALAANTSYTVTITAQSITGARAATTFSFRTAAAPTSVSASVDGGAIRVNGGAFFPLISWKACPDHWALSVTDGINLFGGNACTGLSALTTGVAGQALAAGTSEDPPVDAPSLLGWFYPDEADARGLTTLTPTGSGPHFLTLTQHFFSGAAALPAGRGMYPSLIAAADVVGFDLYPLQELCRPDFLAADFDAQQQLVALTGGKPTFQWVEVREMKCPNVPVTNATIRAESWLALAGGAHGLGFFPNDWNAQTGAAVASVAARVRQLEPALLEPAEPVQIESSSPDVRASSRTFHGARYVFVVNAGTTPASVTIPELAGSAIVLGSQGTALPPLGVRIYVVPPGS